MTGEKKYVLYFHRNSTTNDVFYVGIGDLGRAYRLTPRSRNVKWSRYVKKYGAPIVEIVHENLSFNEACEFEKKYISQFGRKEIDANGILMNLSEGGEKTAHGYKHTPEARKKISEASGRKRNLTPEQREALCIRGRSRKHSEESKRKMSLANSGVNHPQYGKHRSQETIDKLRKANIGKTYDGRRVVNVVTKEIFRSAVAAAKTIEGVHPYHFYSMVRGKRTNKTDFLFLDDYLAGKEKYVCAFEGNKPKRVKYLITGEVFESVKAAERCIGINEATIRWRLKHKPNETFSIAV